MTKFQASEQFCIEGPAGQLEIAVDIPRSGITSELTFVMCHPNPQAEGTMHNKVVTTATKAMNELGIPAVRFNYRGVGASEGAYGEVLGERDDCLAVLEWVKQHRPGPIWLGGFSFGSNIAFLCQRDERVQQLLTIAPAVTLWDISQIEAPTVPWLCVIAGGDEVVDSDAIYDFVKQTESNAFIYKMHGASHFFHKKLIDLRKALKQHYAGAVDE